MTDYVGAFLAKPKDLLQYGVRGMKWGIRRSDAQLAAASGKKGSETATSGAAPAKKSSGNIQDNVESSSTRYARLDQQARAGKAFEMTEQDLKFYNARTEALSKVNKMHAEKPSWLRETATTVIQTTAQRQMQSVADALADKYVGAPIKNAITGAAGAAASAKSKSSDSTPSTKSKSDDAPATKTKTDTPDAPATKSSKPNVADRVASKIADSKRAKADKQYEDTKKKIDDIEKRKLSDPSLMTVSESIAYYRANPTSNPTPPAGLSPGGTRIWWDQIKNP